MTFEFSKAKRVATPLLVGVMGPSGSGKTFSALRLATGMQRVTGGRIAGIDTENGRMLHYADRFDFDQLSFSPPFSPSRYVEAIEAAVSGGYKVAVVDSTSHEWTGEGGVLDMHDQEVERLAKSWRQPEAAVQFPAWAAPKAEHRKLLNLMTRAPINLIFCFRAKQKLEMPKRGSGDKQPKALGWMPESSPDLAFELTALALLNPGSKGVPDWNPSEPGSEMVTKRPAQFEAILRENTQLSEEMGEKMARWAAGEITVELSADARPWLEVIADSATLAALESHGAALQQLQLPAPELQALRRAYAARKRELT